MSWCASSVPSHWDKLRPSIFGRSQARRTTWIATSGRKTALGSAAGGVREAIQALGEKPLSPLPDHRPLHADRLSHRRLGMSGGQQEEHLPPARQPSGEGGRLLPSFQGLPLFGG